MKSSAPHDPRGFQWRPLALPFALWCLALVCLGAAFFAWPQFAPLGGVGLAALLLLDHVHPQSRLLYRPLVRGPRRNQVALTFDDGPNGTTTHRLLDLLKEKRVTATFFLVGSNVERHPEVARRIVAEGHTIGNHTWSHRKLLLLPPGRVTDEIRRAHDTIQRVTGRTPTLFRAPHGFRSPFLPRTLRLLGYRAHCAWTRGVWDTDADANAASLVARAVHRARPGEVVLLHDGLGTQLDPQRDAMLDAVPRVIDAYRDRGYEFVTLDRWLAP